MKSAPTSQDNVRLMTALTAGICFSLAFLLATFAFKKTASEEEFNYGPLLFAFAIIVPATLFAIAFWQIHARTRAEAALEQECARITVDETIGTGTSRRRVRVAARLEATSPSSKPTDPVQGLNL